MNLRPGSLPRLLLCHSRRAGFSDFWPTIGFFTTASLKWSTTAAMANAPPSRSYKLDSVISCLLEGSDGFLEASHRVHRWFIPSVDGHHALPATTPTPPGGEGWRPFRTCRRRPIPSGMVSRKQLGAKVSRIASMSRAASASRCASKRRRISSRFIVYLSVVEQAYPQHPTKRSSNAESRRALRDCPCEPDGSVAPGGGRDAVLADRPEQEL